jgi:hypothetical protein
MLKRTARAPTLTPIVLPGYEGAVTMHATPASTRRRTLLEPAGAIRGETLHFRVDAVLELDAVGSRASWIS